MRIINDPALKQALINGAPYDVIITVTPVGGSPVVIDLDHVAENGISINPSSVSGNRLELGTVIASAATFVFYNHDGSLDGINFKGAEIHVQGVVSGSGTMPAVGTAIVGSAVLGGTSSAPQVGTAIVGDAVLGESVSGTFDIGYFLADDAKEQNKRITVTCLDRMILFDVIAHMASIGFPITLYNLVSKICLLCGVTLSTPAGLLPNESLYVVNEPQGKVTYRQLIAWAAALMGRCAMINNEGELELKWYSSADWDAAPDHRFEGGESAKQSITTTGVRSVANGVASYTAGADDYTIDITDNDLLINGDLSLLNLGNYISVNPDLIIDEIWNDIGAVTYYPIRADIIHNVVADVFDIIDFTELDGTVKSAAITDVVYNITAHTVIESKGQSEEEVGYAQQNPFTQSQAAAIADAGRLKIGRIESVDESIYYDLDTGDIHTENTTERVTSATTKATYKTALDFSDGEMRITLYKNGTEIGSMTLGTSGFDIVMDESESYSYPKPSNWDSMSPYQKSLWWFTHRLVSSGLNPNNRLDNSMTITDKDTSTFTKQAELASTFISVMRLASGASSGSKAMLTKDGITAQEIGYTVGDLDYHVISESKYNNDKAEVNGTIAAKDGIKIGSSDYDDPDAKAVATEEYAQKLYMIGSDGNLYAGMIKSIDGKPFYEYEEVV